MLSQTIKFFNSQIGDVGQEKSHLYTHVDNALVKKRKLYGSTRKISP